MENRILTILVIGLKPGAASNVSREHNREIKEGVHGG